MRNESGVCENNEIGEMKRNGGERYVSITNGTKIIICEKRQAKYRNNENVIMKEI